MLVADVMTPDPLTCIPEEHVGTAAWRMWEGDCGCLPVVDGHRVVGVITDRDIAIALALRGRRAEDLRVAELTQGSVFACSPEDSLSDALAVMAGHRVRRLPVLDAERLVGILSMHDLIHAARATRGKAGRPTFKEVTESLKAICTSPENERSGS